MGSFFPRTILFFTVLYSSLVVGQGSIVKGRILDEDTGSPLEFADVYLSGTTLGNSTDINGSFKIANVPEGNYQLVASTVGYNSVIRDISIRNGSVLTVELSLKPKIYEIPQVDISAERPPDWDNCYEDFKKLFLGSTKYAGYCTIVNPEVLSFHEPGDNFLTASADSPLVVINKFLGYKIICVLKNFSFDRKNSHLKYLILPRFFELGSSDPNLNFANNRLAVYEGSVQHFLKSLINNDFLSRGYKVHLRPVYDPTEKVNYLRDNIDDSALLLKKNDEVNGYDLSYTGYLKVSYGEKLSWIKLEYNTVTLNHNGFSTIYTPFEVRGFWATEGISTLLPTDFGF